MPTAARISISLSAAAALAVLWIAVFPSPGNAELAQPDDASMMGATFASTSLPVEPSNTLATRNVATPLTITAQHETIRVPDLTNLPVWVARKRAKNSGFGFEFMDGKRPLARADYGMMRTRAQSLEPGSFAQHGSTIEFDTEERFSFASGY